MASLSTLRPAIASNALDAPNPIVDRAIVDAARELCGAASIWRDQQTVTLDGGEQDVTLATDVSQAEVVRCISPGFNSEGRPWPLYRYVFNDPRVLHVGATTKAGTEIEIATSLRPVDNATELPDVIALDHHEAIVSGALYRVLRMTGVRWGNPELAMYYGQLFRSKRANAIAAAERGFATGSVRAQRRVFSVFRRQ